MSDRLPAIVAIAVGLAMLAGLLWASRHAARRRDSRAVEREDRALVQRAAMRGRLEDLSGLDDAMTLADALGINRVHDQCRRLYRSGFRSHVHSDCLDILEREEQR